MPELKTRRPRVGDRCYEVEWCSEIPRDENGDSDMDAAKMHVARFSTHDEALAFAKEVYPRDAFGSVCITPMQFSPYDDDDATIYPTAGFWDATGDSEHYDGTDHA